MYEAWKASFLGVTTLVAIGRHPAEWQSGTKSSITAVIKTSARYNFRANATISCRTLPSCLLKMRLLWPAPTTAWKRAPGILPASALPCDKGSSLGGALWRQGRGEDGRGVLAHTSDHFEPMSLLNKNEPIPNILVCKSQCVFPLLED